MTTLPRFRHLAAGLLALCLAGVIRPSVAHAGNPDFAIKTRVVLDESNHWIGTWTMNGVIHDSGVAAVFRYYGGLDTLWIEGEGGSMIIGLVEFDPLTEERINEFVVTEGTEAYESWLGTSGTFSAHFSQTNGGQTLKGFLP